MASKISDDRSRGARFTVLGNPGHTHMGFLTRLSIVMLRNLLLVDHVFDLVGS